ncbi:DUF5916 domain-containing protein [Prolixibacter bellariivorans]|nr:DUF5916 domain-containing protein [Prolixibacter bellariivorans]
MRINIHGLARKMTALLLLVLSIGLDHGIAQNKMYVTERITKDIPVVDGVFNDKLWKTGKWESGFFQKSPENGKAPSQQTAFQLYYDNNFIYVAIKCYDNEPDKIVRRMSRRDGETGDRVTIEFDSYNDKRTSFIFGVNAAGVKNDGVIVREDGVADLTPDPIWVVKTQVVNDGWNAEMKIPVSQLRFNNADEMTWGLQVKRFFFRNQEYDTWQNVPDSLSGWINNYGKLKGIHKIKARKSVEIAPYVMSKMTTYEKQDGNPFADGRDFKFDAGVDGKIGLTNDLTIDFAINPDFGQVEADPSVVNLTAFETYYDEKRPFFIEGSNITNFNFDIATQDNLFYSRRIGRAPQGIPSYTAGEYVSVPERTKILGAVKLSGKTKNGWSVAVMENVTKKERATIDNHGERRKETVEPASNYFLTRLQKDMNQGNTILGGMVTSVYRNIENDNLNFLNTSATTAGLDFTQYFKNRKYALTAKLATSHITGSKEAMLYQQLSSRRYYQSPDAAHSVDTTLTSMIGSGGSLMFSKGGNKGFNYGTLITWRSPGFETNDIGYLKKSDYVFQDIWAEYIISKPFSIFRLVDLNADVSTVWNFRRREMYSINTSGYFEFTNHWNLNLQLSRTGENIQRATLRGGPSLKRPGYFEYLVMAHTSRTKKVRLGAAIWQALFDDKAGRNTTLISSVTYRPANALMFYISPTYDYVSNALQYVTQKSYEGEPRYIVSHIKQESFYVTIRADYSITPDLTLQYYASPFISGGLYDTFKRVTHPMAASYSDRFHTYRPDEISYSAGNMLYNISENGTGQTDYSFGNPNFNFKQFRSNLVLRWEYHAGSVLYLVWSQSRTGANADGTFDFSKNISDLFKITPTDVILLKLSYRFLN